MKCRIGITIVLVLACIAVAMAAQDDAGIDRWTPQLSALEPSRPIDYFELGEDIADAAETTDEIDLAKHLFALAGAIDIEGFGRSTALAMAELEDRDVVRNRLMAMATLLDERTGTTWKPATATRFSTESTLAFGEAMSHHRQGQGSRAIAALREAEAMDLLEAYEHIFTGGARRFIEDCGLYRSGNRPSITRAALQRVLKVEEGLLGDDERSWSSDLVLSNGVPLVEIDPTNVEQTFGLDGTRALYRDGRWVAQ